MRTLLASLLAILALLVGGTPAQAIVYGTPDGDRHPYVGLVVAFAGGMPTQVCSGTLVSPTLFVTAGHCTYGADHAELWFRSDLAPNPAVYGVPFVGEASGTPLTHPDYDPADFRAADVGIVRLTTPVVLDAYGVLPAPNQLDALRPGRSSTFTAVGYGMQRKRPDGAAALNLAASTRMVAYPHLLQINRGTVGSTELLLSNNAATGGTCLGDSGGPYLLGGNVVAAVTSYRVNDVCAGTGGAFRLDRPAVLGWLTSLDA